MSNSLHHVTGRATILTSAIQTSFWCEARKFLTGRVIVTRPREQRYLLGTERDQCASSPPAHSLFAIQDPIRGLQRDPEAAWLTGVHASMDRGNEAWFKSGLQLRGGWGRRPKGNAPRSEASALRARWLLPARSQPPNYRHLRGWQRGSLRPTPQ